MHQVLFRIPVPGWSDGIPVQGFGLMLLLAFLSASWLARVAVSGRLGRRARPFHVGTHPQPF